jgi:hypothetical protein
MPPAGDDAAVGRANPDIDLFSSCPAFTLSGPDGLDQTFVEYLRLPEPYPIIS